MTANIKNIARVGSVLLLAAAPAIAQPTATTDVPTAIAPMSQANQARDNTPANVLSPEEWRRVDVAVNRGLDWLARQQQPNGSFPTLDTGQPGVTCLCMMALVSHGHMPGDKRFGTRLEKATDFAISCQKQNGLLTLVGPNGPEIDRDVEHEIGTCAAYNHAISSLALKRDVRHERRRTSTSHSEGDQQILDSDDSHATLAERSSGRSRRLALY